MKRKSGWGGARPGSGRKPKSPDARRRHPILVRVSALELAAIERAAAGEPLATWVRATVLRAARRR